MLKKIVFLTLFMFLFGCSLQSLPEDYQQCPLINIKRDDARVIQIARFRDNYEIELIGTEAFCYYNERIKQEMAVITPIFRVNKLQTTDEQDVDFSWFTNTIKGPPAFLGKKTYFVSTHLKSTEREKEFKGKTVEVRIPKEMMYEFEIFVGLNASPMEKKYNQRLFDVDLGYMETDKNEELFHTQGNSLGANAKETEANE